LKARAIHLIEIFKVKKNDKWNNALVQQQIKKNKPAIFAQWK